MRENKEIFQLVLEMIYVSFSLIYLTFFWYIPRKNMQEKIGNLGYHVEGLSQIFVTQQIQTRKIVVENKDGKGDLMLVFKESKKSDMPIYYQVIVEGKESEARFRREDGAIYRLNLAKDETTTLQVRMWTEGEEVSGVFDVLPVTYKNVV